MLQGEEKQQYLPQQPVAMRASGATKHGAIHQILDGRLRLRLMSYGNATDTGSAHGYCMLRACVSQRLRSIDAELDTLPLGFFPHEGFCQGFIEAILLPSRQPRREATVTG